LTGYGHFNPGQVVDEWVDEDDTFKAVKTNGTLSTKIDKSWGLWVVGTKDPSYGTLEISIDNEVKGIVDCYAPTHQTRQLLFATTNVTYGGRHKVTLHQVGSKPVAFRSGYSLRSDHGMCDFVQKEYHVKAGEELMVNISRVLARTNGSVLVQAWPDTAFPGEDYEDVQERVVYEDNISMGSIIVKTMKRKKGQQKERKFMLRLSHPTSVILGFNYSTTIVISPGPTPSPTPSKSKKMSKAAIAGIAGGAAVILIAAVVIAVVALRRSGAQRDELLTISRDPMMSK
jgi:hypothetical protein